jgi:DnaJ-class molecular chaperone
VAVTLDQIVAGTHCDKCGGTGILKVKEKKEKTKYCNKCAGTGYGNDSGATPEGQRKILAVLAQAILDLQGG